jgi:hypothetical protein
VNDVNTRLRTATVLSAMAFLANPITASAQPRDEVPPWRATIYGWFPSISGSTNLPPSGGEGGGVSVDARDILDALDFVFMAQLEFRRGRWGGFGDLVYLDLSDAKSAVQSFEITGTGGRIEIPADVSIDAGMTLDGDSITLAATYAAVEHDGIELLTVGGLRSLRIDSTVDWTATGNVGPLPPLARSGTAAAGDRYWDAIVGLRGRARLGGSRWYAPLYLDVGTGDSDLTWQAMAGLGYSFEWGEITLAYRHLEYDFEPDAPLRDLGFSGVALGLSWRW